MTPEPMPVRVPRPPRGLPSGSVPAAPWSVTICTTAGFTRSTTCRTVRPPVPAGATLAGALLAGALLAGRCAATGTPVGEVAALGAAGVDCAAAADGACVGP